MNGHPQANRSPGRQKAIGSLRMYLIAGVGTVRWPAFWRRDYAEFVGLEFCRGFDGCLERRAFSH
jgi:hypothetical protein